MGGNRGSLGSDTNSPVIDAGTLMLQMSPVPGPMGLLFQPDVAPPRSFVLAASPAVTTSASASSSIPTIYHPGISHKHRASGRWGDVQAKPNSSMKLNLLCPRMTPKGLIDTAIMVEFRDKPIALTHLRYYLAGTATDFVEDANIDLWLRRDKGIQAKLAAAIPTGRTIGSFAGSFKVEQSDFVDQDFRFAFGAIDIVDFEVNFGTGTVHLWFQDYYEWHPYYPGLYSVFISGLPSDDGPRETNCVHAALVELKLSGAADFWMKGEATVPLSVILPSPASGGAISDL